MTDLLTPERIEELRQSLRDFCPSTYDFETVDMLEAAMREVPRLQTMYNDLLAVRPTREELKAENKRLREALEYIGKGSASDTGRHPGIVVNEYERLANKALEGADAALKGEK